MLEGKGFKIVFEPNHAHQLYSVKLLYIKFSPLKTHGFIPRIGRKKLLEKLGKYGVTEKDFEEVRQPDGSHVFWWRNNYMLLIKPIK